MSVVSNTDLRIRIAELGVTYKDVAGAMGISAEWLSTLLRQEVSDAKKAEILKAAQLVKDKGFVKVETKRIVFRTPVHLYEYLQMAAFRESDAEHIVTVKEYLCNLIEEDMKKHNGGNR